MTTEDINKMEAGIEMDALVAEKVMGWEVLFPIDQIDYRLAELRDPLTCDTWHMATWHPSTFIADAWKVVEKVKEPLRSPYYDCGYQFTIQYNYKGFWVAGYYDDGYDNCFSYRHAEALTAPLAISRAALKLYATTKNR